MAFQGQLNEPVDQLRIGHTRSFPELRVHANGCEAGKRIYLIEVHMFRFAVQQKVYAGHPRAVKAGLKVDRLV